MRSTPLAPLPAAALALLVGLAAPSPSRAQSPPSQSPKPAAPEGGESAPRELSLVGPDLNSRADLIEAAKVKPVPPETLERVLPAKVAGLARTKSNKTVQPIGPVVLSLVTARYGADGAARTVEVTVLDPAGLPTAGEIYPLPAAGETVDFAGRILRRTEVRGFPAVVADGADGLPSLLQVIPAGRIRVTMQGYGVSGADLAAAASSMDLAKLSR